MSDSNIVTKYVKQGVFVWVRLGASKMGQLLGLAGLYFDGDVWFDCLKCLANLDGHPLGVFGQIGGGDERVLTDACYQIPLGVGLVFDNVNVG